jgi:hypothetical protein
VRKSTRHSPITLRWPSISLLQPQRTTLRLINTLKRSRKSKRSQGRRIHIAVWGWDTLQERINQSELAKRAFDPGFSPSLLAH